MADQKTKEQKLAELEALATDEGRFFRDYRPQIEVYLDDEDSEVRAAAVECLWEYPAIDYIDMLIEMAESDSDEYVRQKALAGLGIYIFLWEMSGFAFGWGGLEEIDMYKGEFDRVYDYLIDVINDEGRSLHERRHAIEAISFSSEPEVLDIIEDAYQHSDTEMKVSAVFAMSRNGDERWDPYVLESLHSSEPAIRYEAVGAAGELGLERANRQLMRLATDPHDKELRIAAIWSLGQIGDEVSFSLLEKLQHDPDEEIREVAEAALDEWLMFAGMDEDDEFDEWLYNDGGNGDIPHD